MAVGVANASAPSKSPVTLSDTVLTSGYCPFPVLVEFTNQNESMITYADGSRLVIGSLTATFTNLDNQRAAAFNLSGSTLYAFDPLQAATRATFSGSTIVFGAGFIYYVSGHGNYVSTAAGIATMLDQQAGIVTDICAALAG
jgi:hypothetical protein